jgi:hypothetical protein
MSQPSHIPFRSLEQFRLALISQYLTTFVSDVVVQEKIHGSNISIVGVKNDSNHCGWDFHLGSRRRWISPTEKFNNIQSLFNNHRDGIIYLFNELYEKFNHTSETNTGCVRLYGEVFGGKYGGSTATGAIKTQREPNYGPSNDFAFFDAYVDGKCIPINDFIEIIPKYGLKIAPIIYKGPLAEFLESFDVNDFNSVVSKDYYGLDFIDQPKATEGVVIRSVNPDATGDEATVLKYKQTWAVENPRVNKKLTQKTIPNVSSQLSDCLEMMNEMRMISYKSKNTIDELTNPRLIGNHVKELVADTMRDVIEEFPPNKFPDLDQRNVSRELSKKAFPMFKQFVERLGRESLPNEKRLLIVSNENSRLCAEVNTLKLRIENLNKTLINMGV